MGLAYICYVCVCCGDASLRMPSLVLVTSGLRSVNTRGSAGL